MAGDRPIGAGSFTSAELAALRTVLRSALVSDALDAIGLRDQALGSDVVRLAGGGVLVGRARTVTAESVDAVPDVPYVGLRRSLEVLGADDVYVLGTGRSDAYAGWGELVSMAAMAAGAAGFVTDGLMRDRQQVQGLGFEAFGRGTTPRDINGRAEVVGHGLPVAINGITIHTGDLVVGDDDGVVVVPEGAARDVVNRALVTAGAEASLRAAVTGGLPVMEALSRFDIL